METSSMTRSPRPCRSAANSFIWAVFSSSIFCEQGLIWLRWKRDERVIEGLRGFGP